MPSRDEERHTTRRVLLEYVSTQLHRTTAVLVDPESCFVPILLVHLHPVATFDKRPVEHHVGDNHLESGLLRPDFPGWSHIHPGVLYFWHVCVLGSLLYGVDKLRLSMLIKGLVLKY